MPDIRYRFGDFLLDSGNRRLLRGGEPVPLNSRYFDALVLLVSEHGRLVPKQRLFDEVWTHSVVTDAALTQCIKEVRRQLGDDAAAPRFVRTVPGHGYSFIAAVVEEDDAATPSLLQAQAPTPAADSMPEAGPGEDSRIEQPALPRWLPEVIATTAGGALAGLAGGVLYGSAMAFTPQGESLGGLSVLLVLVALSVLVGMTGALGVGAGIAAGRALLRGSGGILMGGAFGGLLVGGLARLLGADAFTLLVGRAPEGITGGIEGAAIGLAVAAGLVLGGTYQLRAGYRPVAVAAAITGLAGALIALAGGSMMATSLARVAAAFAESRLDLAPLGRVFGEPGLGPLAQAVLGALEGAVFGGCLAAALGWGLARGVSQPPRSRR